MRTLRPLARIAAASIPALLGMSLVAGVQPAAASDCAATSTRSDGQLDAGLLQSCLRDQVESSFGTAEEAMDESVAAPEEEVVEAPVYDSYDALDAVFSVEAEIPLLEGPVDEAAPAYDGLGGAFAALRDCESGGDYGINTGNGYYGAYQFSLETWQSLGYGGYPHEASPATQDQAASELQSLYGWGQWPGCSWYLGLG